MTDVLEPESFHVGELGADLHDGSKVGKQVTTHTKLGDARADIADRLVPLRIGSVGIDKSQTVEDDDLQLVQLGLLPADLLEADLLRDLCREDDRLLGLVLRCILLMQGREEVRLAVVWPGGADEGCRCWRVDFAYRAVNICAGAKWENS
jgi:hypothetical protein